MKASTLLGALIGRAIDRKDGDSGVKGAVAGIAAVTAARALAPIAVTLAIGYGVQRLARGLWRRGGGAQAAHEKGRVPAERGLRDETEPQ